MGIETTYDSLNRRWWVCPKCGRKHPDWGSANQVQRDKCKRCGFDPNVPELKKCWHCGRNVRRLEPNEPLAKHMDYHCVDGCHRGWQWANHKKEWHSRSTASLERYTQDGRQILFDEEDD